MIFTYQEINKLPVMIIDRFYDKHAEEKIMQELLFLNNDENKLKDSGAPFASYISLQRLPKLEDGTWSKSWDEPFAIKPVEEVKKDIESIKETKGGAGIPKSQPIVLDFH
jgi:hypothetical protein